MQFLSESFKEILSNNMEDFIEIEDFEKTASKKLSKEAAEYFRSGVGAEDTLKLNEDAFKRYRIIPQVLADVSHRDISVSVLGEQVSMPLGISPTGNQKWAHLDGECATAKAAQAAKTIFILSCYSNSTIQEVAAAAPNAIKWMQLSIGKDRKLITYIVGQAEKAGFKAIVVTVDNPIMPMSKQQKSPKVSNQAHLQLAVYKDYFLTATPNADVGDVSQRVKKRIDDSLTWQDIIWLKSITKLPIVVKGVLSPIDANFAAQCGASAIIVSNHGGRQLDGVPATMEVLPLIVQAAGHLLEVYVDGGVRRGTDVFKALALGAKMVFFGRPVIWGLACGGQEGVHRVLEIMRREIDETFALAGYKNIMYLRTQKNVVVHESYYLCPHMSKYQKS